MSAQTQAMRRGAIGPARFSVYICTGNGKNRRESGSYEAYGNSYLAAAADFASHYNRCSFFSPYGSNWRKAGRRPGMPRRHCYVKDERGNKLLLIATV